MTENYGSLETEQRNPRSLQIDRCNATEILKIMSEEDHLVPDAVEKEIPHIAQAVNGIFDKLKAGGRLFYIGAGTSGRLGVVDASECPPTYGTSPEMIQAIIAGGDIAIRNAIEGAEDSEEDGAKVIKDYDITDADAVVGITASGGTPFVVAALRTARQKGAFTVSLTNSLGSKLNQVCEVNITPLVGPEVVTGSTRLKAGTSQKLVLNMISTTVMILLGKVYGNLMVDLQAKNKKLRDRSIRIVMQATGADKETADKAIRESDHVKAAIVMLKCGIGCEQAKLLLNDNSGLIVKSIDSYNKSLAHKEA